jgi:nucleotide-binding universal stress UspA family protein
MVLNTAHRLKVSLVVLGPHGNSTFVDAVSGTITQRVLGAAACPVLIAHQEMQGPYRQVLVALDGAPSADGIVHAVESLGLTRESLATVVHAHEPPYVGLMNIVGVGGIDAAAAHADISRAQAATNIRNLLGTYSDDASLYEVVVVEHRPATAILGIVDRLKPDLLVLGTRGHGRFRRALLGSVANEVMSAVHCDVLLVPERVGRVSRAVRGAVAHAAT